ncbi:uncharacterized protein [Nicotiana sylvestris]|uniref:uncharacterized protein n=1 Tax=Nicotiana sylvestris TaxID=4096 RepID=UPI00388C668B
MQEDSGFDQDESYNEQEEEVQHVNNFQGRRNNSQGPNQQQWRPQSNQGGDASTSSQRELVDNEQVVQEYETPNNVVQVNDEVRIDIDDNVEEAQEEMNPSRDHIIDIPEPVVQKAKAPMPRPPPPYSQRIAKQNRENQFKKFIEMMKSLSINVSFVEALEKMPRYAKFMKDLVTKKRSMNCETIKMTHQMSAIVHSMSPKLEDPGSFTIPCTIGSAEFAKALCDLGESINLMSYLFFKTLEIGQPRPISMRLQMTDHTMKRPLVLIEDVLVRVDKFILLADFVILDCEVDYESMWQPNSNEVCSFIDLVTDVIADEKSAVMNVDDTLEAVLLNFDDEEMEGFVECSLYIDDATKEKEGYWMDIGGYSISPAFYMHKINLEKGSILSIEHQRRLNEAMKEVVKKDIIKWCMMEILTDMVEDYLEVFMDDFSVVWNSFDYCLTNLDKVLARCKETNSACLSFLGHAGFYRRFIKDFSKVVNPLCKLLEKDAKFHFNDDCMRDFELLKFKLTTTPIITAPNKSVPFELMCDESDIAVRAVFGETHQQDFSSGLLCK